MMELTIVMLSDSHTLCVNPNDRVGSLKRLIQDRLGVPCERQRLVFDRTPLSDDLRTLSSYSLQSGSQVTLLVTQPPVTQPPVIQPPATFQVFLRNEKGAVSPYDIRQDETVNDFKIKVQNKEGVAVSQQRLVFEGKEMTQGKLSDYHVKEHSTINMVMRLRGG